MTVAPNARKTSKKAARRRIHRRRTYTFAELAKVSGRSISGLKKWLRKGLKSLGGKPALLLGSDVLDFMDRQDSQRRRPTSPGTLYCTRCKTPRPPANNQLEYVPRTANVGRVSGTCAECGCKMSQMINPDRFADALPGVIIKTKAVSS